MPSETAATVAHAMYTLVWFRQNLRIRDNAALCAAVAEGSPIIGIWIDDAETGNPRRTAFYRQSAAELAQVLAGRGIPLYTAASPAGLVRLAVRLNIRTVIADASHTFADKLADNALWHELDKHGIALTFVNDRSVFDNTDLIPDNGTAHTDFNRYREVWLDRFSKHPPPIRTYSRHTANPSPKTCPPRSLPRFQTASSCRKTAAKRRLGGSGGGFSNRRIPTPS